jgi:mono/diheme cytochrome c family protein
MKTLIHLIGWTAVTFALLQLIRIDIPTPPAAEPGDEVQAPAAVMQALKKGCYDCHSNRDNIPWYGNIAPVSFEVRAHVRDGRKWLNFSLWNRYDEAKKQERLEGIAKTTANGTMPLPMYLWAHKEARLTPKERKAIVEWAKSHLKE